MCTCAYGETHSHTHTHTSASHTHTHTHTHTHLCLTRTHFCFTHTHTHTHKSLSHARTHLYPTHTQISVACLTCHHGCRGASQKGSVCVCARYPPHLILHLAATATPANTKRVFSDSWTVISHKRCANTKHGGSFSTLTAAQAFCLKQGSSACSGVYDDHCDGKGSFLACKLGGFASSSMGSCVYTTDIKGWFMVKYCFLCWHACAHS